MAVWLWSLASVVLVSLLSLAGILPLAVAPAGRRSLLLILVSFSVGGLFGDAFIHLIPEAYRLLGDGLGTSLLLIAGIMTFFVLEKFLCWRHCHIETSDDHPHRLAVINLVGDAFHNFIDGVIIGASYQAGLTIGLSTTLAVVLHEIPQEIGDFGVLIYSGMTRGRALLFNFLTATTAIAGAVMALALGPVMHGFSSSLLPFAAGGFIYLAGSDLIPELHKEINPRRSLLQLLSILGGVAVMSLLLLLG